MADACKYSIGELEGNSKKRRRWCEKLVAYTVSILFLALSVFLTAVSQVMIIKRQKELDKQLQKLQRRLQQLE